MTPSDTLKAKVAEVIELINGEVEPGYAARARGVEGT